MNGEAWWAAVHGVSKSQTRLNDFPFTFHFPAFEKEMATHSSILAWRIPGTGEPGGLPSMGSHRVGHDWSDLAAAAAAERKGPSSPGQAGVSPLNWSWVNEVDPQGKCFQYQQIGMDGWADNKQNYPQVTISMNMLLAPLLRYWIVLLCIIILILICPP